MQSLFVWLTQSLHGNMWLALAASFGWGVFSILLSPCHLASIPLIVGFINGQGIVTKRRAFVLAGLFSIGILITIAIIGLITGMMGRILGDVGSGGHYFVAVIFFIIGLHLLEIIHLPFAGFSDHSQFRRKGLLAAFVIGLLFGIALGPCTFAFMAPVLGIAFSVAAKHLLLAAMSVIFYAIGHCSVIVLAGTFTSMVQQYLNWNERSRGALLLKKICGILVILGGAYLIYSN